MSLDPHTCRCGWASTFRRLFTRRSRQAHGHATATGMRQHQTMKPCNHSTASFCPSRLLICRLAAPLQRRKAAGNAEQGLTGQFIQL